MGYEVLKAGLPPAYSIWVVDQQVHSEALLSVLCVNAGCSCGGAWRLRGRRRRHLITSRAGSGDSGCGGGAGAADADRVAGVARSHDDIFGLPKACTLQALTYGVFAFERLGCSSDCLGRRLWWRSSVASTALGA